MFIHIVQIDESVYIFKLWKNGINNLQLHHKTTTKKYRWSRNLSFSWKILTYFWEIKIFQWKVHSFHLKLKWQFLQKRICSPRSSSSSRDQLSNIKINKSIYTSLVCLPVCLYPINVKTVEPIGPKHLWGISLDPREGLSSELQKFASNTLIIVKFWKSTKNYLIIYLIREFFLLLFYVVHRKNYHR